MARQKKVKAGKVCRLLKSLYALKQSPMAWFGQFTRTIVTFGCQQRNLDHSLL